MPPHILTDHKRRRSLCWENRDTWSEHGIYQTCSSDESCPWSTFQTRQGSSTVRLGVVRPGDAGLGQTLAKAPAASHLPQPSLPPKNTSLTGSAAASGTLLRGRAGKKSREDTPLEINSDSKTLTIDQGKSETRKCFIGKVQKNQSLQLNLQQ